MSQRPWRVAVPGFVASALGFGFAAVSTTDYAAHLDRGVHDLHCSLLIGAAPTADSEACRAAMYSPYSAVLKDQLWGGIPISLFALGAFAFFAGLVTYLLVAGAKANRAAAFVYAGTALTPLLVSIGMFTISMLKLGSLCKVCVGIYIASGLLAVSGLFAFGYAKTLPPKPTGEGLALALASLTTLALATLLPAVVYAAAAPSQLAHIADCGKVARAPTPSDRLIALRTPFSKTPALLFEDPLCPTCKAFHERLVVEGVFDKLDATLVLFPLDSECNWMLSEPLHPGACMLSKAILCSEGKEREAMDWAYRQQESLANAGKAGKQALEALIAENLGIKVVECMKSRDAQVRLNKHLHFSSENRIPVSTPQAYLSGRKLCEEDTDIGLKFTLTKLAPELFQ